MNFDEQLQNAIARGKNRADEKHREAIAKQLTEEEYQKLHSQYRLQISEYIEQCVQRLPHHFPGFRFETIYGERGWGAACFRDDFRGAGPKRRDNDYSRLEITVRPFSKYHVIDLAGKGTIGNKEVFSRNHYENLDEIDPKHFFELIDRWILEFAEMYSASN